MDVKTYITTDTSGINYIDEVTEEAALKMLCAGPEGCGSLFLGAPHQERLCVASRCMAWRWKRGLIERTVLLHIDHHTRQVLSVDGGPAIPMDQRQHIDAYEPQGEGWHLVADGALRYYAREHARRGICGFMEKGRL